MVGLLIANGGVTVSEFVGIGAAAELFGVSRYVAVPIMAVVVWWLIVKGNYRQVERVFLALTLVFLAYPISAVLARPDWGQAARHAVIPTILPDPEYILLFVATVGTTISPYMQVGQQDLVVEKGVTVNELGSTRLGVVVGTVFAILVAIFIIIATAATLYTAAVSAGQPGVDITTADQAARALEPLAGRYAEALFGIGIFGASMLAAGVLPLATALSVCEAFGWERGVELDLHEAPVFYGLLTLLIAVGALVALIPGVPVIRMLIAVQVINGLVLPIILICVTRISGNHGVMGKYANGRVFNAAAWLITSTMALLALLMVATTLLQAAGVEF
jgi:Mn2+/Fe2+ NRAMP family transporter